MTEAVRLPKDFAMACVLCQKDRELKESHILSRFIYKPLKKLEGKIAARWRMLLKPNGHVWAARAEGSR